MYIAKFDFALNLKILIEILFFIKDLHIHLNSIFKEAIAPLFVSKKIFYGFIYNMKISPVNYMSRKIIPLMAAVSSCFPLKTAQNIYRETFPVTITQVIKEPLSKKVLQGLKIVSDTNHVGGITHHFDDKSVKILKARIMQPENLIKYKAPIENAKNVYLDPFGMFFANRPGGNIIRPHLGLDIFVSPYSRKPEAPVIVQAPIDGVVISHKFANKNDNLISNSLTILGRDGRRYAVDHLARPEDYPNPIKMPTVGSIVKAGDKLGYVGATGETTMWHTHFVVMTDEKQAKQIKSKFWNDYCAKTNYSKTRGQVNPLDEKEAGPIAKLLKEYRGANRLKILSEEEFQNNAKRKK